MQLEQIITQYITYRKSLGEKFRTNEVYLKSFSKAIGPTRTIQSITEDMINNVLYGNSKTITSGWFIKHTALLGFYRYALARNYVMSIPLPKILPKRPQPFIPYIYSQHELKLLFDASLTYQKNDSRIGPKMVQTVLLLTYALGLRPHETLSITLDDIDIENSVITIRQSKFYKTRLVPFNQQIKKIITDHLQWRVEQTQPQHGAACLFASKNNLPFNIGTIHPPYNSHASATFWGRY